MKSSKIAATTILAALVLAACGSSPSTPSETTEAPPVEEQTSTEEATEEDPQPVGVAVGYGEEMTFETSDGEVVVVFDEPMWDAEEEIGEQPDVWGDGEAPALPDGTNYIILPITITNNTTDIIKSWDTEIQFIGSDGTAYGPSEIVPPARIDAKATIMWKSTHSGNKGFEVPKDVIDGGYWSVAQADSSGLYTVK